MKKIDKNNIEYMKKFCVVVFTLILLCANNLSLFAQDIKGRVYAADENRPLAGATIRVLATDSTYVTGFTTDDEGRFEYLVDLDKFGLEVSYVGYEKNFVWVQNSERKNLDLGTISLALDSVSLGSVEVVAQAMVHKTGKILAYPSHKQVKAATSSLSLLQSMMLPRLLVDPVQESVSIQGVSGVIFRINGVEASLQEVKALKPEQIARVDYSQLPSMRELDSNSGVLDFILKEPQVGSSLAVGGTSAFTTGFINGNFNFRTNYKKSQFSVDYNVNYRDYSERRTDELETYSYPDGETLTRDKRGEFAPFGYTDHNIAVGYLFKNDKDMVNVRFNNQIGSNYNINRQQMFQDQQLTGRREIHSSFSSYVPSLDFTYSRKIKDNQGVEVNLVGTLAHTDYERTLTDRLEEQTLSEINNTTDGNQKSLIGEVYYWNEGEKVNFSAGLRSTYQYASNLYGSDEEVNLQNYNAYPYVQLQGNLGKVAYTIGTGLRFQHQKQGNESVNYWRNTSSLSLSYQRKYWDIQYSINFRPLFPSLSSLSEVIQEVDSLSIIQGNHLLSPYNTLRNQIDFSVWDNKKFASVLTLVADRSFHPILQDIFYSPEHKRFVFQENNQDYDVNYGAQLIVQMTDILNLFMFQVFGGWNYYKSKGAAYEHTLNNFYYGVYVALTYKGFNLYGTGRKPMKYLLGQSVITSENNCSIGASYKWKRVNIGMGLMFPFTDGSKYRTEQLAKSISSDRNVLIRNNRNMFYVRLSYNINWGRSIFQSNKRLQNSDNVNSILKVNDN